MLPREAPPPLAAWTCSVGDAVAPDTALAAVAFDSAGGRPRDSGPAGGSRVEAAPSPAPGVRCCPCAADVGKNDMPPLPRPLFVSAGVSDVISGLAPGGCPPACA